MEGSFAEVSFVEGLFNIIKYQNGTRIVSLVVRCPLLGCTDLYCLSITSDYSDASLIRTLYNKDISILRTL